MEIPGVNLSSLPKDVARPSPVPAALRQLEPPAGGSASETGAAWTEKGSEAEDGEIGREELSKLLDSFNQAAVLTKTHLKFTLHEELEKYYVQIIDERTKEVVREVPMPGPGPGTVVVDKPLRSGQQVYARGADLVVMAVVSFGAEVIADGNIHVYAPLRGRAIAGARGNTEARIFSTCLEPQLVSIAGIYRTTETELPAEVRGKPAQVRLEGEKLLIEPLA